jgi:hypothetical protein
MPEDFIMTPDDDAPGYGGLTWREEGLASSRVFPALALVAAFWAAVVVAAIQLT